MLRRIYVFALMLCVLSSFCIFSVEAEAEWDAKLSVEQTSLDEEEMLVSVRVSIGDITTPSGIMLATYSVLFDSDCLEYVSHKNGAPQNWTFVEEHQLGAHDWSKLISVEGVEPYFYYTLFNDETNPEGVTEDGVLYTDLTFRITDPSVTRTDIVVSENLCQLDRVIHSVQFGATYQYRVILDKIFMESRVCISRAISCDQQLCAAQGQQRHAQHHACPGGPAQRMMPRLCQCAVFFIHRKADDGHQCCSQHDAADGQQRDGNGSHDRGGDDNKCILFSQLR